MFFDLFLLLGVLILVIVLVPSFRNWFLAKIGYSGATTLSTIIGDLEKKVKDLVDHSDELKIQAAEHADDAAASAAKAEQAASDAARATAIAQNVKTLIAN
jgi:hypothetical protein